MRRLIETTDNAAITVIGQLDDLEMSAEDAFEIGKAENLLRAVVESSPHFNEPK